MSAAAYIIFHCSSKELQARAGFDGWVLVVRDWFDTEDQAWPQERLRLATAAKRKLRKMESGGVELDMLQLVTSCHLLLDPPAEDREEERIWCIEFFRGKMYDFVADDRELVQRLKRFQEELLYSARQAAPKSPQRMRSDGSAASCDGSVALASARPSGDGAGSPDARPANSLESSGVDWLSKLSEDVEEPDTGGGHIGQRKPMSAASLAAALDITDLMSAQQRFGGGAFLPILPLEGSDTDSIDRGLPTLPTSTARWPNTF